MLIAACSLDNRDLQPASAGAGPTESGSGGQAVGGSAGQAAGSTSHSGSGDNGAIDSPIPVADGCADLDVNQVADCTETNVQNSEFNSDVANWRADTGTTIDWDASNAAGDRSSGSALVASPGVIDASAAGFALRAAQQCIPISGAKLVIVYANAWVDPDQDEQGRAEVDVAFYDTEDCSGALTTTFSTPQPLDASIGSWLTLKAGSVSRASTKSAQIKLALLKPFRSPGFQARFDNVLVRVENAQP